MATSSKNFDRIVLIDEDNSETYDLKYLKFLCDRTGVPPNKLLQRYSQDKPKGLIAEKITPCLRGERKTLREDYYDFVLAGWLDEAGLDRKALERLVGKKPYEPPSLGKVWERIEKEVQNIRPNYKKNSFKEKKKKVPTSKTIKKPKPVVKRAPIPAKNKPSKVQNEKVSLLNADGTPTDILLELRNIWKKTGISPNQLLKEKTDIPDGLSVEVIKCWLKGKTKGAKKSNVVFVLEAWKAIPEEKIQRSPDKYRDQRKPQRRPKTIRKNDKRPDELTSRRPYQAVSKVEKILLLNEDRTPNKALQELIELRGNSLLSPGRLLKECHNIPEGLTDAVISGWLSGKIKSANRTHFEFVKEAWKTRIKARKETEKHGLQLVEVDPYLDTFVGKIILITPEVRDRLISGFEKTGQSSPSLLKTSENAVPSGLTARGIRSWLKGDMLYAPEKHLNFVLEELDGILQGKPRREQEYSFFDIKKSRSRKPLRKIFLSASRMETPLIRKRKSKIREKIAESTLKEIKYFPVGRRKKKYKQDVMGGIPISSEYRDTLKLFFEETKLRVSGLLRLTDRRVPSGLLAGKIEAWINGETTIALEEHLHFVLEVMQELKRKNSFLEENMGSENELCLLNQETIEELIAPRILLERCDNIPIGLTDEKIRTWLSGRSRSAPKWHVDFVLDMWRSYPDVEIINFRNKNGEVLSVIEELENLRIKTGVSPEILLQSREDVPEGLSSSMVRGWLAGGIGKAKKHHVNYVRKLWTNLFAGQHE